jgi:excinuclease UvrABC nuclease subunit
LVKNLLLILRKIFPYSTCKLNQKRPCFYYQIGLCPGKCAGTISARDHQANINNLLLFLSGQRKKVEKILKKTAPQKLNLLKHIDDSMLITGAGQNEYAGIERIEGYDISHFSGKETVGAMVVCENDDFDKSQYRLFKVKSAKPNDDLAALRETITRRLKHKEWPYPDLIMVDGGKAQVRTIEKILVQNSLNIPVVGIAKSPRSVIPAKLVLDCDRGAEIHGNQINIDSRFRGNDRYSDRLIFGRIQKSLKDLISIFFPQLLKIRNEAHRFANSLRKKMLEQSLKNNRRSQSAAKIRYFS